LRPAARALAFDVFGTVVDWRGSIAPEVEAVAARRGLAVDGPALADAWRRRYRPSMERVRSGAIPWTALDDLHRASLEELIEEFGLQALDGSEREHLNRAWHRLRPWPDSVGGLQRLRRAHVLATLSNGNVALLVDLVRFGGLPFDCVLSAELCRAYKPDPRTYRMVPELLRLRPEQVLMVAAHQDDLRAAAGQGLRTCFVRRPLEWGPGGDPEPEPDSFVDLVASDLLDLADQLESAREQVG
jgi:2-haloacid dehalogenase